LTQWNVPYPNITDDILPNLVLPIKIQTSLGWEQLFQGRIATKWASAIDEIHPTLPITGEQVLIQMTTAIWKHILAVWQVRNNHLHHMAENLSLPNYRQAAQSLYKQRHQLPPAAQEALFRQLIDTVLNLPRPWLQRWVQRGHAYFNQQLKAAKKQAALNTMDIRSFFNAPAQRNDDLLPP